MNNSAIAKIVCVFNEKGGAGKTTTTCQLAGTLGERGYDVLVADLDTQQTSSAWMAQNGGVDFKATSWAGFRYGANLTQKIQELSGKYDIIIADCAPSVEQATTWGMLLVSDLALIPTRLSPPDLNALPTAKRLARKATEAAGREIKTRVVANATRMHMRDAKEYFQSLEADKEIPPMKTTLSDLKAYERSMLFGSTAHAVQGGEKAVAEIERLTDEVLQLLNLPKMVKKNDNQT